MATAGMPLFNRWDQLKPLIADAINHSYPPDSIRRKIAIQLLENGQRMAFTMGVLILGNCVGKLTLNSSFAPLNVLVGSSISLSALYFFPLFAMKTGSKIKEDYELWAIDDKQKGPTEYEDILPSGSIRKYYAVKMGTKLSVALCTLTGILYFTNMIGSKVIPIQEQTNIGKTIMIGADTILVGFILVVIAGSICTAIISKFRALPSLEEAKLAKNV